MKINFFFQSFFFSFNLRENLFFLRHQSYVFLCNIKAYLIYFLISVITLIFKNNFTVTKFHFQWFKKNCYRCQIHPINLSMESIFIKCVESLLNWLWHPEYDPEFFELEIWISESINYKFQYYFINKKNMIFGKNMFTFFISPHTYTCVFSVSVFFINICWLFLKNHFE